MNTPLLTRRATLQGLAFATVGAVLPALAATPEATPITVWKDPQCGCCGDWIAHMQANGFAATLQDTGNTGARARLGLDRRYGSCHTALVGGYVIEGHVPAREVRRLLREKPDALGLAVPGMPVGSPGMDGPVYGGRRDPYDVLLVLKNGSSRVFQAYRG